MSGILRHVGDHQPRGRGHAAAVADVRTGEELQEAALAAAVKTARAKAQVLADAAGCQVGSVINIRETSGYSEARYNDSALTNQYRSAAKMMELEDTAGSIMPGEIQVEAGIVVEYALTSP